MMTTRLEIGLLLAFAGALLWAVFGPAVPQHAHYHDFADARVWLGVHWSFDAFALDGAGKPDLTRNIGGVPLGLKIAEDIFAAGGGKAPKKSVVGPRP